MASIEEWETLCINTTNVHNFLLVVDTNAIVYSQYFLLSIKQSRAHSSYSETEKTVGKLNDRSILPCELREAPVHSNYTYISFNRPKSAWNNYVNINDSCRCKWGKQAEMPLIVIGPTLFELWALKSLEMFIGKSQK